MLVRNTALVRAHADLNLTCGHAFFGAALAHLDHSWLATGAPHAAAGGVERGAVYLLALGSDGRANNATAVHCLNRASAAGAHYGAALAALDVNGDG